MKFLWEGVKRLFDRITRQEGAPKPPEPAVRAWHGWVRGHDGIYRKGEASIFRVSSRVWRRCEGCAGMFGTDPPDNDCYREYPTLHAAIAGEPLRVPDGADEESQPPNQPGLFSDIRGRYEGVPCEPADSPMDWWPAPDQEPDQAVAAWPFGVANPSEAHPPLLTGAGGELDDNSQPLDPALPDGPPAASKEGDTEER